MAITKPKSIDEYIAGFPKSTQKLLEQMRATIMKAAPDAVEVISYGMPAIKLNKVLVFYAAYEHHIGFYPTPSAIIAFQKDLSVYKSSKGAVQFPIDQPLPLALITKIVMYRMKEDMQKAKKK